MRRLSKQSNDLPSQRSQTSTSFPQQYSQSFVTGSSKKFLNLTLPNIQPKPKQFYKKQPYCVICSRSFTTTFRQHHCRFCVNAVCGDCSRTIVNKQRACDLCVLRFTNPHQDRKKKQILQTMQTLCAYLIYQKNLKLQQFQSLKQSGSNNENPIDVLEKELAQQNKLMEELEKENNLLRSQYSKMDQRLNVVRENNSEIQNKISDIQKQMEGVDDFHNYNRN